MTKSTRREDQGLISYEKALTGLKRAINWRLPIEQLKTEKALGRVLRQDLRSGFNIPPFRKSAMDGYAVKAKDTEGATEKNPAVLSVIEEIPAGKKPMRKLGNGDASRIMTGAALPEGADAVVMVEYTKRDDKARKVKIFAPARDGQNMGQAGEDVKKGSLVLSSGIVMGPAEMGMAASLGKSGLKVTRKPKVAVISTGDELNQPGKTRKKSGIYDSNGYSLVGLANARGCEADFLGIARDSADKLKAKLKQAEKADLVLLTGGVSVGDYDFVTEVLRSTARDEIFYGVAIQPGKPTFAGKKSKRLFFGLPGNPVSCMVCFELFVRPAIDLMTAKKDIGMIPGKAYMEADFKVKPGRRKFLRASITKRGPEMVVTPFKSQKSGVLSSMIGNEVLIDVPGGVSELKKDSIVGLWWR